MTLNVTRRAALRALAYVSAVTGTTTAALTIPGETAAPELPVDKSGAAQERYDIAKREFIAAAKALHPDVPDWRIMDDPCENAGSLAMVFQVVGHHRPKAVRS